MKNYLGIELGSTRIKCAVINEDKTVVSSGEYSWKSDYIDGIWTYSLDDAVCGLKNAVKTALECFDGEIAAAGVSGMMHGYLAFDKDWKLLVPFRTWQNTITAEAAEALTGEFGFNIPQRWSIAHLYQAILNDESHVKNISHITTLAGYIHHILTEENVVGIGEASGIFPIDSETLDYDNAMLDKFDLLIERKGLPFKIRDVLPKVMPAGVTAGTMTEAGEKLLSGMLTAGTRFAAPEGDAGTGMVATNAVRPRTGNVSAGTSIFAMIVLERPFTAVHKEIDIVATPSGKPVAMVHCNNCTNDINEWFSVIKESVALFGASQDTNTFYTKLYELSLSGKADCGGVVTLNYLAGEGITHFDNGRPFVVRTPDAEFSLANLVRSQIYSTFVTLKLGMRLLEKEQVGIDSLTGHGGLFKTRGVAQRYLSAALNTEVTVMEASNDGGPYGMAILASYLDNNSQSLEDYLSDTVFADAKVIKFSPIAEEVIGFESYTNKFVACLKAETELVRNM